MNTAAVICEYNPFHNGHLFQLFEIRKKLGRDTRIIAIMSGNYVQRGDVAILDKYSRAECAVRAGASLVLELPFPYSASSAEFFSYAGVCIADKLGCVDYLCFGCEDNDILSLNELADNLSSDIFLSSLSSAISNRKFGNSGHAEIIEKTYSSMYGSAHISLLRRPNNILAVEYIKALKLLNSRIEPMVFPRAEIDHDSSDIRNNFASASLIRQMIREGEDFALLIPDECKPVYSRLLSSRTMPSDINLLSNAILAFLRIIPAETVDAFFECGGGLGRRLRDCAAEATSLSQLISLVSTKKFTTARIRRAILFSMLGITSSDIGKEPKFTQLLAMDEAGQALLSSVRKTSRIPIITKPADYKNLSPSARAQAEISYRADSIFSLTLPSDAAHPDFMRMSPFRKNTN